MGCFSISGPYYDRIVEFGLENPKALLNLYRENSDNSYLGYSLFDVFDASNRYLLLDHLDMGTELIDAAIEAGLHEEYPQEFLSVFKKDLKSNRVISTSLVEHFAKDILNSEYQSHLEDYAVTGFNKWYTLEVMADAGYEGIESLATEAWAYDETNAWKVESYQLIMSAYAAARYGNKEALEAFVNYYIAEPSDMVDFNTLILKLFKDPFNVEDFNQNKALLIYNQVSRAWQYS